MIIALLYQLLFFLTPLLFSSANSEFFELPKMYFVYSLTLIILVVHLFNYLRGSIPLFKKNIFTIPLFIFLISQIISTIFSIDVHTSIFGYYSRLNGGLLSLISYSLLFSILPLYLDDLLKNKIILSSLLSGFIVAVYGIAEHFGIDKNIWVQDVQNRVFSTLGQPNWLAAYLCILLPLTLDRILSSKSKILFTVYSSLFTIYYICLLFTKSKSGIIATVISLGFLGLIYFIKNTNRKLLIINFSLLIILSLIISNPVKDFLFPSKLTSGELTSDKLRSDILITPSGDIRKIVWRGSFDLWKQFPLFGTGPETFAYSYYWTRPMSHNLTSEWNFLYNKAHNEYLNYLATTGTFGILSYIILILFFSYYLFRKCPVLFASFLSILITNSVGFSVVITSLYFFLLPALIIDKPTFKPSKSPLFLKLISIFLIINSSLLIINCFKYYLADIAFAAATSFDDKQQYTKANEQMKYSLGLRQDEPIYFSKNADILAKLAITQKDPALALESENSVKQALSISPFNLNLWKESAQTFYYLSTVDKNYYLKALDALTKATKLAPTDAMSFYLLGKFYQNISETDSALQNYQQALVLKPNYDYASFAIAKIYYDQKKYIDAKPMFEKTIQIAPGNLDAQNYLNLIATSSGSKK